MSKQSRDEISFEDHNQNFWQLASIQATAMGLPVFLIGGQIAKEIGPGAAIVSVLIGNLILWIIALAIVGMTGGARTNAIENVKRYLGKPSGVIAAFVLIAAFLAWFSLQIRASITFMEAFLGMPSLGDLSLRIGATLGLFISLLSVGGIRLIKWICVASLPILTILSIYFFYLCDSIPLNKLNFAFSFSAITSVVIIILPGIVNLPTFFRHSRSKPHSFLAISLMTILISFFQCLSIYMGVSDPVDLANNQFVSSGMQLNIFALGLFVLLSLICINLVNIYLASAGWETIVKKVTGPKEYAIVGLAGTAVFTFLQINFPMQLIENVVNSYIASLGVVLLIAFLIRIIVRHRPRIFEKIISNICWFFGCIAATQILYYLPYSVNKAVLIAMGISALAFLVIIFIEETVWSIRKLTNGKRKRS